MATSLRPAISWGRLPVLVGADDDGHCVAFESFAYHKLGYHDEYELGPAEIVRLAPMPLRCSRRLATR